MITSAEGRPAGQGNTPDSGTAQALNDAGTAGKAIGVGLIIAFWMVVDVILGISYGIYKLAQRSA